MYMIKKTKYRSAPKEISEAIASSIIIDDFLPSPEELLNKEETVKVTLAFSRRSLTFLKNQAKRNGVSYQRMLRRLVDQYADHYMHAHQ